MLGKLATGLLLTLILLGISRVEMDVDVLELLPGELPAVNGLQLFLEHFSKDDELIITLEGDDPDELIAQHTTLAEHLRDVEPSLGTAFSEDLWTGGENESLGELVAWLLLNGTSPQTFSQTIEGLQPSQRRRVLEDSLDTIANSMEFDDALTLAYDPYQIVQPLRQGQEDLLTAGDEFASADGTMRLLYLQAPPGAAEDYQNTISWVDDVKSSAQAWQIASPERATLRLGFTGEPVFQAEIASSMERDMKTSGVMALVLTSIIFALAYRRLRPLLALIAGLTLTFLLTLGLAGWSLDSMTVMSAGFAAILIGLTVDYGVIIYQASLDRGQAPAQLQRRTRHSIGCAAVTTAAAFGALGLSMVPGIATLGQLVALGILVGAVVMLWLYPRLMGASPPPTSRYSAPPVINMLGRRWVVVPVATVVLLLMASPVWMGFPPLDTSTQALRPRESSAYDTMDRLEEKIMAGATSKLAILTLAENSQPQLDAWETRLEAFPGNYFLPRSLIPNARRQAINLAQLDPEQLDAAALQAAAEEAGFEPESMELTTAILDHWQTWRDSGVPPAPASAAAQRLWSRLIATGADGRPAHLMLRVTPDPDQEDLLWPMLAREPDSFPVSWRHMASELNHYVPRDLRKVGLWLGGAVVLMLALIFRRWQEIALALGVTLVTLLSLCGAMQWLGWEWNFFSLAALLLTFGAGLDYSIHILLDRRHHRDDMSALRRGVIRALTVCALSTIAGFASISWASNQGLASLGRVCALALMLNALVALILLPWALERVQKQQRL